MLESVAADAGLWDLVGPKGLNGVDVDLLHVNSQLQTCDSCQHRRQVDSPSQSSFRLIVKETGICMLLMFYHGRRAADRPLFN
jgi:hypothetical protein